MIFEICCGCSGDAKAAWNNGAKRIELNSALNLGGLTPSVGTLISVKQQTYLEIIAMNRPRAGGFCYTDEEFQTMLLDTQHLLSNGAHGIAFGILNSDRTIDLIRTAKIVELIHSYGKIAVFHRAFDCTPDLDRSMRELIAVDIDRVLTSGGVPKAFDGIRTLKSLQENYGDKIEILAGSGVTTDNALQIMEQTGLTQVHSSCKAWVSDPTTVSEKVSYAFHENTDLYDVVSGEKVRELVNLGKK